MDVKFIVDDNVGRLAKWLRMIGYDALFINGTEDRKLIAIAMKEGRVLLTRDTQIMKRRVVTGGRVKAIFIRHDEPREQLRQVVEELKLDCESRQFTRCLECNHLLEPRSKEEVRELVPPYVFRTRSQYMQCPRCQRIYWRGTHWQRMKAELDKIIGAEEE
jgi:hypothetical protein